MLALCANGIYSKRIYLVETNAANETEANEGMKDVTENEVVFNHWDDDEKNGADYAATPVLDYEEGSDVKLKCPSPVDFQDCQFKAPSGKIHKLGISGNAYKSGRIRNLHGVSQRQISEWIG